MKIIYYPDSDTLSIEVQDTISAATKPLSSYVVVDLDDKGQPVEIMMDTVSRYLPKEYLAQFVTAEEGVWDVSRIRALRQQLKLRQNELAGLLGVTVSTVSRWENGHNTPDPRAVEALNRLQDRSSIKTVGTS